LADRTLIVSKGVFSSYGTLKLFLNSPAQPGVFIRQKRQGHQDRRVSPVAPVLSLMDLVYEYFTHTIVVPRPAYPNFLGIIDVLASSCNRKMPISM
ncbi:hypothetical protein, partial [Pseudoflavonifractor capillosus]|uniref:hypothetical protein n=1 Tax=Pseudoflavonifractor capillosus TaxID=106588 RepID=UPI0019594372